MHEDDLEEECVVSVPTGPMALVKESFDKATGVLLDILLDLVSGKHFSDCQELASQAGGMIKALQNMGGQEDLQLLKELKIVTDMFDGHSKSITPSNAARAPSLLTPLTAEGKLDHEADAERDRHWKMIQSERRRFVSFGIPKNWSKDGLLRHPSELRGRSLHSLGSSTAVTDCCVHLLIFLLSRAMSLGLPLLFLHRTFGKRFWLSWAPAPPGQQTL